MGQIDKKTFATSTIWKLIEIVGTKGVSTIISIILARLLLPEDYGIVAITAVFINLAGMLVSSGLETSLIQKKDVDDLDFSNALFFSLSVAGIIYIISFFIAPYIAGYYGEDMLTAVLRVQMLSLFIGSFSIVRNAIVTRRFQFKKLCIINAIATIIGGMIGIIMAYCGFGVWALVFYTLSRDLISTIVLLIAVKWHIVFRISFERLKKMISYSVWILIATLADFVGNNIYNVTYGKVYSLTELGYYNKGAQLPELVGLQSFGAITSVLLPALSEVQNDVGRMKKIVKKIVKLSTYIIFPMMFGMIAIGKKMIVFLFTEKWLPCVPILWAACINYAINPLRAINMQLIYASGDSRRGTMIETMRLTMMIINLIICGAFLKLNMYEMTFSTLIIAVIVAIVTQYYAKKIVGYGFIEWIKDIIPAMSLSVIMLIIVLMVGKIELTNTVVMFMQIISGAIVYIVISAVFKVDTYQELLKIIKGMKKNA